MDIYEVIARESIRDLVARYNAKGDAGLIDEMMALFAEDALLEVVDSHIYRGIDEIRGLFEGAARTGSDAGVPEIRFLRHHTSTHQIDMEGAGRASGRCYFVVFTEKGPDHWGRYVDRYIERGGRWLFEQRRVHVDARVPGGWGAKTNARLHASEE
jgi:ketosteroid isomerase-like protein